MVQRAVWRCWSVWSGRALVHTPTPRPSFLPSHSLSRRRPFVVQRAWKWAKTSRDSLLNHPNNGQRLEEARRGEVLQSQLGLGKVQQQTLDCCSTEWWCVWTLTAPDPQYDWVWQSFHLCEGHFFPHRGKKNKNSHCDSETCWKSKLPSLAAAVWQVHPVKTFTTTIFHC